MKLINQLKLLGLGSAVFLTELMYSATKALERSEVGIAKISDSASSTMIALADMVNYAAWLIGGFLVLMGLYNIYRSQQQGSQVKIGTAFIQIAVGGCCFLIGFIIDSVTQSVTGTQGVERAQGKARITF